MHGEVLQPNPLMIIPFGVLLGLIALGPLFFPNWWLKHYPKVAIGLGAVTLTYFLFVLKATTVVLHTAHEYVSFIALIGSLYVVSGGIHINVKGEATPAVNVLFLLIGAVLSNILGTTGASMLLIRPWLRMNKYRVTAHHVVFFIFIVSNLGGCLTPIGDPPLFLGYLKGIPFWWVAEHCWPMWALAIGLLLVIFYFVDLRNFRRAPREVRAAQTQQEEWRFEGAPNVFFLLVILGSVFINNPPFLREALMVAAAIASYYTTKREVHKANDFNFHPIQEVAILFIGIFATMMPALMWLEINAAKMTNVTPGLFYWGTGLLSSMLDNAPTYLSFLSAVMGTPMDPALVAEVQMLVQNGGAGLDAVSEPVRQTFLAIAQNHPDAIVNRSISPEQLKLDFLLSHPTYHKFIVAISVGAVFFGACTYIGNGPNFMVKSIAEQNKVNTPSFLAYLFKFSFVYLLPVLVVTWLVFFW